MKLERRILVILVVLGLLALPAAILRVLCVGRSCTDEARSARRIPFCSLPDAVRTGIAAGYREDRSPDILTVTRRDLEVYSTGVDPYAAPWPSLGRPGTNIPVVFTGFGIEPGSELPAGFGLDDISPTLAEVIGFKIPHPEVRSGRPASSISTGERPRLVAIIVLRRVGQPIADPTLASLAEEGAATMTASAESLPLDTSALITTIGTGGVPAQHGITGTVVKNPKGKPSQAWFERELGEPRDFGIDVEAPGSVIATLADDLDEEQRQEPKIGLIADTIAVRGLVGGNWYVDNDSDIYRFARPGRIAGELREILRRRIGRDRVTDVIGISFPVNRIEGASKAARLIEMLQEATANRTAAVVVALPRMAPFRPELDGSTITQRLDEMGSVIDADTSGGLFLDQAEVARTGTTKEQVITELRSLRHDGEPIFADVFPGLAVSFARFC